MGRELAPLHYIRYSGQDMVLEGKQMQEWWEKSFTSIAVNDQEI
ncbi:hypothetical protein [Leptolyngbya sp. FACHB-671]|nr:hypothetical protein [Leptolyngbya sp. FACHB-671]